MSKYEYGELTLEYLGVTNIYKFNGDILNPEVPIFEYKNIELINALNSLGEEGWKLINYISGIYIMMREVNTNE